MIDYREILRLDSLGYSRRRISSMVNSSHHTVEDTLKAAHDNTDPSLLGSSYSRSNRICLMTRRACT